VQANPTGFSNGHCANAPPFPELRIGADGSIAVGDGSACGAVMPSPATCQTSGICPPWTIDLNFRICPSNTTCHGIASTLAGFFDGSGCSEAIIVTRIGP
jgi:hypothetical protein